MIIVVAFSFCTTRENSRQSTRQTATDLLLCTSRWATLILTVQGSVPVRFFLSYCSPPFQALYNCGASLTADTVDTSPRPLIDAIKRGKLDEATLDQILNQSPDSLSQTEPVTGNHALHCAVYKKDLLVLLDQKVKLWFLWFCVFCI